jgi:hypothetical protein
VNTPHQRTSHEGRPHDPGRDFDAQARQLHDVALGHLGPATLARLRAARHQATTVHSHGKVRHRSAWWLATACSAVLAVGLGVHLNTPVPSPVSTSTVASADGEEVFEQNPDLYVWLASDGALAMEQTR